jgi:predicted porin
MKQFIVGVAALAMVLTAAMNAAASEWNFYGNARIGTFFEDIDIPGGTDTTNFREYLHGNSRIGAKVRVSDQLRGRFEYGTGVNVRQLWGEWNFGAGSLLVGQGYTPLYMGYSTQVWNGDNGLENYGACSVSRRPMIQLTFGGLEIAAVQPASDDLGTGGTEEISMPKMEISFTSRINNFSYEISGGYNSYELSTGGLSYDVDSWVIGLGAEVKFGPAYLAGNVYTGENLGPYGVKTTSDADPVVSGSTLLENSGFGFILVGGYKFSDMVTVEAGYGYEDSELDNAPQEDDSTSYYIQAKLTLAPGVYITPEIGIADHGQDRNGAEEEETLYYGCKWQISF